MFCRALLVAWLCTVLSGVAAAETVTVKYRGPVPLDTFQCATLDRNSLVERVCYDAAQILAARGVLVITMENRVFRNYPRQANGQHLTAAGYHSLAKSLVSKVSALLSK